jgi:hypothetical protein
MLGQKLAEAGADVWGLLECLGAPEQQAWVGGPQVQLLEQVFSEQRQQHIYRALRVKHKNLPCPKIIVACEDQMILWRQKC